MRSTALPTCLQHRRLAAAPVITAPRYWSYGLPLTSADLRTTRPVA